MEKFIHKYLTQHYTILTSDIGNHGIYLKSDKSKYKAPFNGQKLLKELSTIFNVDEQTCKLIVQQWVMVGQNPFLPLVNLEFYWKTNEEIAFPEVLRVQAHTIAQELLEVKPMKPPSLGSNLMYFDMIYG